MKGRGEAWAAGGRKRTGGGNARGKEGAREQGNATSWEVS